jgi:hypothetical protein
MAPMRDDLDKRTNGYKRSKENIKKLNVLALALRLLTG